MTVNVRDFVQKEERKVKVVISGPKGGSVSVYEPNKETVDKVIEINSRKISNSNENEDAVLIDAKEMLLDIFPLFTDLNFSELSETELQRVIDNPPFQLLQIQGVVKIMLSEINKIWANGLEANINQMNSMLAQVEAAERVMEANEKVEKMVEIAEKKLMADKANGKYVDKPNHKPNKPNKPQPQIIVKPKPEENKDKTITGESIADIRAQIMSGLLNG